MTGSPSFSSRPKQLRLLALAVAVWMVCGSSREARADASGWLGLRAGLGLGESLLIDTEAGSFESAGQPSLALGITGLLSLGMVELGAGLELSSAAGTPAPGGDQPLFAQLRAVGLLRWHFVSDTWGGLFMGIGAGLSATRLSDFVRLELARPGTGDRDGVERAPLGLALDAELGAVFALSDALRLGIVFAVHTTASSLLIEARSADFITTQTQLHLGLEWAL